MRYSQHRLRPMFDSVEEGRARYESRQIDAIRGIETVKVMGAEESLRQRMAAEFGVLRDKLLHADVVVMIYEGLVRSSRSSSTPCSFSSARLRSSTTS